MTMYKITRITRPNGEPVTDVGSIHRIGQEGHGRWSLPLPVRVMGWL